jgi:coenzyme F420 hydrogenase subunit beta
MVGANNLAPMQAAHSNPVSPFCTGCGACVSENRDCLEMHWTADGFLAPRQREPQTIRLDWAKAIRVCPFNPRPDQEIEDEDALGRKFLPDATHADPVAGRFERTYAGYSHRFRKTSSSGGIATHVFNELLQRGLVQHVFTVTASDEAACKYSFVSRDDEISGTSRTRYYPVTLDELFQKIESMPGPVAVSGVACFIKAIRLKQHYHPALREKIPFLVGIICGGLKSRAYTDFLAQSAGIKGPYSRPEYRIKDDASSASDYSFGALDDTGSAHQVKMRKVGDVWGTGLFKSRACDFCTDVFTELADISVGDAWIAPYRKQGMGNSVVVTRTSLADEIIQTGIRDGALCVAEIPLAEVIASQAGSVSHRQAGIGLRLASARQTGSPQPFVRRRMIREMPLLFGMVQRQREVTRSRSLRYWLALQDARTFARRMKKHVRWLKLLTRAYRGIYGSKR